MCVVKPDNSRNRAYREIYFSQRFNVNIYSKTFMIDTINKLKEKYEVSDVILSSTKKYPHQVPDYFKGISL